MGCVCLFKYMYACVCVARESSDHVEGGGMYEDY